MGLTCKKEASSTVGEQLEKTKRSLRSANRRIEIAEGRLMSLYQNALEDMEGLQISDQERAILTDKIGNPSQFLEAFIFLIS